MTVRKGLPATLGLLLFVTLACNLTNQAAQSVPTATPASLPTVTIITPVDGATVPSGQQVDIRSVASDTGGGVTAVELRVDGTAINRYSSPEGPQIYETVQQTWTPDAPGAYTIEVVAYRGGVVGAPDSITLNVAGQSAQLPADQAPAGCAAMITAEAGLRVRSGPGTDYDHLYSLPNGTTVAIIGRVGDNSWWQVRASDGLVGWVSAAYTDPSGDCRFVPVVQPPLAPTPAQGGATAGVNLQVANIEGPAEATRVGGSVTATFVVTLRNAGSTASGQFTVSFYPQGRAGSAPPQTITVAPLRAGATLTMIFNGIYGAPGLYSVEAVVDSGGQVSESDEGDNVRIFTIQIF
ncbi:MAG: SH3 domain-containing protein [Anaerolineae bacterium]|nr:SH3 domain-containing protein [Anaerolineae bacterium]